MAFTKTTLQYATQLTVSEILTGNVEGLSDKLVKHTGYNRTEKLDADSTVPVTLVASFSQVIGGGGTVTIDLMALLGTNDATVDGEGLKIQAIKMSNPVGNDVITATFGASDPYELAGAAWSVALLAGQEFVFFGNEATPDIVAGGVGGSKDIDLAGTPADELEVCIVMG